MDHDGSGEVDFEEFYKWYTQQLLAHKRLFSL